MSRGMAGWVTTRLLAWLPRHADAPAPTALLSWAQQQGLGVLASGACTVVGDAVSRTAAPGGSVIVWNVNPGTRAGGRMARLDDGRAFGWATVHDRAGPALDIYNVLEVGPDGLRLESDRLGMKAIYAAERADGWLLANRLLDLVGLDPGLGEPGDAVALHQLLSFGFPLGGRTLHAPIRRTPAGAVLRWTPGRALAVAYGRRLAVPPPDAGLSVDDAVRRIATVIEDAVAARAADADPPYIALTGGYDSRILLAAARARGLACRGVVYGNRLHHETAVARQVARATGTPLAVLPYADTAVLDGLAINRDEAEATADYVFGMTNLLRTGVAPGTLLLSGFVGDNLGGFNIRLMSRGRTFRDLGQVRDGIVLRHDLAPPPALARYVPEAGGGQATLEAIEAALVPMPDPTQSLRLWDLEVRQRHATENHFRILGTRWDVGLPYVDDRVMDAYFALPRTMLEDRAVIGDLLRLGYPRLARIRHAEGRMPLLPGPLDHLRAAVDCLLPRAPRFWRNDPLPSRRLSLQTTLRLAAVRHIWQVPMYQLLRDRRLLLARMEEAYPAFRALFPAAPDGLDPAPLLNLGPRPLSRLLMVLDYAAEARRRMAGAP